MYAAYTLVLQAQVFLSLSGKDPTKSAGAVEPLRGAIGKEFAHISADAPTDWRTCTPDRACDGTEALKSARRASPQNGGRGLSD